AMTLVELLVVIVLVTILVTTAIPVLSPGGDTRKLREASRAINTYLAGAQARAVETGRPCGVQLNRLSLRTQNWRDNAVVTSLNYVEVPAPYRGFDENSVARVGVFETNDAGLGIREIALQFLSYVDSVPSGVDQLPDGYDRDLLPANFLRVGDRVEIAGATYELVRPEYYQRLFQRNANGVFVTSRNRNLEPVWDPYARPGAAEVLPGQTPEDNGTVPRNYLARLVDAGDPAVRLSFDTGGAQNILRPVSLRLTRDRDGAELPGPDALAQLEPPLPPYWTEPLPYRVLRRAAPATGAPLELPAGIAIDLQASRVLGGDRSEQLYWPADHSPSVGSDEANFVLVTDPVVILFAPDGSMHRVTGADSDDGSGILSGSLALCVGRRELTPAEPAAGNTAADYSNPYDPTADWTLPAAERDTQLEKYNWLRTDTRWVVIGGRSGSIATVANTSIDPTDQRLQQDSLTELSLYEQLDGALESAYARAKVGGR
ncbi:MAG: hypothetical protein AAF805_14560, partial [Planctomycetota bacterium]